VNGAESKRNPLVEPRSESDQSDGGVPAGRKPAWLRVKAPQAPQFRATQALLQELRLHTVCEEARCPNKGECFSSGTATFLIMGDSCTRGCRFCSVGHGVAGPLDDDEPRRVAVAARRLGLRHVVVTSVTRDDLADGGAAHYAATIAALRGEVPAATVEVLIPDLGGDEAALRAVLAARPDVLNHNLETAPRLYARVRPQASYERSLLLLERAVAWAHDPRLASVGRRPLVKTGIMVGLGEAEAEVVDVLADCAAAGVDVVTIGQYLQPQPELLPVVRYVSPREFAVWEQQGAELGLRVQAGPFVRSSYRAGDLL
jgi:lipoic acid synthetase